MRARRNVLATILFAATSTAALAAASQGEADGIKAALEKLLTSTPGVVTVMPNGDAYDLTLDLTPLIAKAQTPDVKISASAFHIKLTPLGNGQWQVDENEPLDISFSVANGSTVAWKAETFSQTGTFDETIGTFSSGSFEIKNYTTKQDIVDPANATKSHSESAVALMKGSSKATAGKNGGVDASGEYQMQGISTSMTIAAPGGMPPVALNYTADAPSSTYSGTGIKVKELLAVAAWFVAHPSEAEIKANQQEIKTLLKAAMPLWENVQGKTAASNIKINSMMGAAAIGSLELSADINGLTKDGKFSEAFAVTGIELPAAMLPPWSKDLLPKDTNIDFTVSGFDGAAAVGMVIDAFDANANPPIAEALSMPLMAAALPQGALDITLNSSKIVSPTYTLTYEGKLKYSPMGMPSGTATIRLKGFDATLKAIQEAAASDPTAQQAIGPMMAAKGFAKQDGEDLLWVIETNSTGGVLVNGVDVTKM